MRKKIKTYSKISAFADIKIEPFDPNKRYTKPHRHNKYLELVYFTEGSGIHYMDDKGYAIRPPQIFVVKKDEIHHWHIDSEPRGYVVILKECFLTKTLDKHINIQLRHIENLRVIHLPEDASIQGLFEIASNEIRDNADNIVFLEGILKALLSKILMYAQAIETSAHDDLALRMLALLETHIKNDVSHYAVKLNTTAQNLNTFCKRKWNKTASTVIAEHIIKEAKRLLLYTDLSVSEIAYKLDFGDVSHFVKYFKRHEGKTPLQFKRKALVP
ncbi:helix-turn-helix domain-containing protein [Pareuzebyella sediminis]|uniref:helix-turn-helix domain-containing protein n=1 Tax=Pareuzebyella sediminis TaxID=2607998 RepID=UPI0011EFB28A|nr:helix-turn-helix domain-containing protein [Pareuzebyella sediminis]